MRAGAVIAALMVSATPAIAGGCTYTSGFGYGEVRLNEDFTATYDPNDGTGAAMCGYNMNDETANELACETGVTKTFALQPASIALDAPYLMVMDDHIWYPACDST